MATKKQLLAEIARLKAEAEAIANQTPTPLQLAQQRIDAMGAYEPTWQAKIDALLQEVLDQKPFSYDAGQDPLYRQYRDSYMQAGRNAMQDTMGQATALTGGYGNSYATTAAQQAYQGYLAGMGDKSMDLYERALAMHDRNRQRAADNLNILQGQEDKAYSRYQDALTAARGERDYAYTQERDAQADKQWQAGFDYQTRKAKKWRKKHPQYFT